MAGSEAVALVQLATRAPKERHRRLKLHCVTADTSVVGFVVQAIEEKPARAGGTPAKRRGTAA